MENAEPRVATVGEPAAANTPNGRAAPNTQNAQNARHAPAHEVEAGEDVALWARIKADYETTQITQAALCATHGVTHAQLNWRIRRDLWKRRNRSKAVDRPHIIARMFRVLELQVRDLETEMDDMERNSRRSGEKEVTLLGKLTNNLDKLIDLDAKTTNKAGVTRRTKQMREMRNKLVERIERLKRS